SLLMAGACDAITDVAQNAHGLRVQREYRRSIINSFHAVWSIGAVLGGSMSALAIALDVPLTVHLGLSGLIFSVVAVIALRFTLPGRDPDTKEPAPGAEDPAGTVSPPRGRTLFLLLALVVIAIGGTLVGDAGNSWASLFLGRDLGAPAALAATGYIALVGSQFIGRLLGDGLVDRFGQRTVARSGGAIIALGMGAALVVPTVPGMIVGFGLAGLGSATLVPAAMQEADDLPGLRHGTGLTVVSWLMRLGFLVSPPVIGLIADASSLRLGLLVVPLAGIAVIALSGVLSPRTPSAAAPAPVQTLGARGGGGDDAARQPGSLQRRGSTGARGSTGRGARSSCDGAGTQTLALPPAPASRSRRHRPRASSSPWSQAGSSVVMVSTRQASAMSSCSGRLTVQGLSCSQASRTASAAARDSPWIPGPMPVAPSSIAVSSAP